MKLSIINISIVVITLLLSYVLSLELRYGTERKVVKKHHVLLLSSSSRHLPGTLRTACCWLEGFNDAKRPRPNRNEEPNNAGTQRINGRC